MMKATKILANEHQTIRKVLDSLVSGRTFIENGRPPEKLFIETASSFSQNFSDKFHHFKEEFLMFGVLAQKKQGMLDFEIGALRFQHERWRYRYDFSFAGVLCRYYGKLEKSTFGKRVQDVAQNFRFT